MDLTNVKPGDLLRLKEDYNDCWLGWFKKGRVFPVDWVEEPGLIGTVFLSLRTPERPDPIFLRFGVRAWDVEPADDKR